MRNRFNTRETLNVSAGGPIGGPNGAGEIRTINVAKVDTVKPGPAEPLAAIAGVLKEVKPDNLSPSTQIAKAAREFV